MTETRRSSRMLFTLTICAGSFLLFLVQPMIARMALPRLGGAPAVWNSAMLVYQVLLLGGYAYAHWIGRFAARTQVSVHLGLFLIAALMLPIGLASGVSGGSPFFWVPWLLIGSIGPLFFMIAAQAPLMQRWFADSGGGDPYPLYAASNLGSFGGLLAYPLLLEPMLTLKVQSLVWSVGYGVLVVLVGLCALRFWRVAQTGAGLDPPGARMSGVGDSSSLLRPTNRQFLRWVILAAVPSGLMLSTSLHLTTDIVPMPLLWVVPLGLYLLSFSLAFSDRRSVAARVSQLAPLMMLMSAGVIFVDNTGYPALYAALGLLLLFSVAVALHSEMYNRRPDPAHLTRFYLAMSLGGVVGGLFCALFAPMVFDWGYEHPILIVAASLLVIHRPLFRWSFDLWQEKGAQLKWLVPVSALILSLIAGGVFLSDLPRNLKLAAAGMIVLLTVLSLGRRLPFSLSLGFLMLGMGGWQVLERTATPGQMTRSFFGTYTVMDFKPGLRSLVHGTTLHGVQYTDPKYATIPLSYYAPRSGIGIAMAAAPALYGKDARMGLVGLGTGSLACYAKPGQVWTIFEIDPVMVEIAKDPKRFTFLSRCLPGARMVVGDARLTLGVEPNASLDMLTIDAFSSDAVPMHLLTREAFASYGRVLRPDGLVMAHISNRFLDLRPVLGALTRDGWSVAVRDYDTTEEELKANFNYSVWVALSRDPAQLKKLRMTEPDEQWYPLTADKGFAGWSDDFSSILPIFKPLQRQ
jgi:SAM-dependent methyltransferase